MVFIFCGDRYHVKHSCRSDASDRVAGDIPCIPPSAHTAQNAFPVALISYLGPIYMIPNLETLHAIGYIAIS
eukprot:6203732-Pleurochrysis_carterae.AAC.2